MDTEVASDAWALLLPDLLLDIFRRLETTAVIRCAAACKPWRRGIISNASRLRLCPDRFNPNLLLGFFHLSVQRRSLDPRPRTIVSVTAADTGHCKRLSSLIPAASAGGVDDQSSFPAILSSRDAWLLLLLFGRGSNSNPDELCLCNPITRDCTFLPQPSTMEQQCEYTIVTGHDHGAVRILAKAEKQVLCTAEGRGRLTYQVFSCGGGGDGDGAGMWGPVQRSDEVDKRSDGLRMLTYGRNAVVGRDGVHWLTGPQLSGCRVTGTVGLDIDTGRAWATKLPSRCQFFYASTPWCALTLTASGDGRLSLLQPLQDGDIKVWALNDAMEWSMQHKIPMDVPKHLANDTMASQYSNVVCPRSGFLFIMLNGNLQQSINLGSRASQPVQSLGNSGGYQYYPYEMDWSTYISNMKNL